MYAIGTRAYLEAVDKGRPVFSFPTLERYVEEDLRLIREHGPDLVIGDFRLSLAVSARLEKVRYWAISNAYWSPLSSARLDIPVHWTTRMLGPRLAQTVFNAVSPLVFAVHSFPMHRLRKKYGMSSLGFDLRNVFTEAGRTLFADVPELVPTSASKDNERYTYIGPVIWSPASPLPAEIESLPLDRPIVYVALGSSGDPALLDAIIGALLSIDCSVVLASGGATTKWKTDGNLVVANFLPGDAICTIAALMICNGGSPSVHQALAQGLPVLGIPSNLDQMLNMRCVEAARVGLALRADQVMIDRLGGVVRRLLNDPVYRANAESMAATFVHWSSQKRFAQLVAEIP